jgi:hypothetical protein
MKKLLFKLMMREDKEYSLLINYKKKKILLFLKIKKLENKSLNYKKKEMN